MATIPFATVEDVERKLGYPLDPEEASALEEFLIDFSLIIETSFTSAKKDIDSIDPRLLRLVVARRGVSVALTADLVPGQTSFSETVGDKSISGSVSSGYSDATSMDLTASELKLLRLRRRATISSLNMVTELPDDRVDYRLWREEF